MQLHHLTALTKLVLADKSGLLSSFERLPPNLVDVTWWDMPGFSFVTDGTMCSMQPLLSLTRLQKLQLQFVDAAPAAQELVQLSSISSLTNLQLKYIWEQQLSVRHCSAAEAAATAWPLLPLKCLAWSSSHGSVPTAVLQHVAALQCLTQLDLFVQSPHVSDLLAPAQLAVVLQQTTALEELSLHSSMSTGYSASVDSVVASFEVGAVAAFLQAIVGLHELGEVHVELYMEWSEGAAAELPRLREELLPAWLAQLCQVHDGDENKLCMDSAESDFVKKLYHKL
jgi:hypothetical protein